MQPTYKSSSLDRLNGEEGERKQDKNLIEGVWLNLTSCRVIWSCNFIHILGKTLGIEQILKKASSKTEIGQFLEAIVTQKLKALLPIT